VPTVAVVVGGARGCDRYWSNFNELPKRSPLRRNSRLSLNKPPIQETIATYQTWLEQSRPVYQEKLWNGQYYDLIVSGSDVVMADQLCGQFYAQLLGLSDIVPSDCTARH